MKGLWIFIGILVASALFCWYVPFVLLTDMERAMALPVISVPAEKLTGTFSFLGLKNLALTNTIVSTLIVDVVVLALGLGAVRKMRQVPGRLQGLMEVLVDALYGLAKTTAGPQARRIFPLMATIFIFVLTANWLHLIPGTDSIGIMHCAEEGMSGYARDGVFLKVPKALDSGTRATEADYKACHDKEEGHAADHAEDEVAAGAAGEAHGEETAAAETAAEAAAETTDVALVAETAARDDIYVVTPFVRGATTDLNLTMALALIAVVSIQVIGVRSLGGRYFAKFINIPALNKLDKKPMGAMDFGVGLLEIISELSRILSFGFRLFGNLFAGQVLLFVIPFLAGALVPLAIYGFELFVGVIQAFVFAMLFLVFAAMATVAHGDHDEHEGH